MSPRALAVVLTLLAAAPATAAEPQAPTAPGAPWPTMRHDRRNTGTSMLPANPGAARPWIHQTGRGIFSTPVIGADGTVYVGSADHVFAALNGATGRPRWRFRTGGIIDAAAALTPGGRVTIGSGDETLYQLRTAPAARRRVVWRYRATRKPATGQLVNWWEGNVAVALDGSFVLGNTGGAMYALERDGRERWVHQTGNSVWTTPAVASDGTTYWGSVDRSFYALDKGGNQLWSTPTLGFVTSSPALSADEATVYIGSFDGKLYALDARTGLTRWSFQTADHIYASPALSPDGAITIASADGSVYRLSPEGTLLWRYDTGDPLRSSPVIGREPAGDGEVVYVGSSDGRLYALQGRDGTRRWSFDTTPRGGSGADRNDLNGSPALGRAGIVIGGEHGRVVFVPYDWCLTHNTDARCDTDPGQPFGADVDRVFPVTAGGNTRPAGLTAPLHPATILVGRLVERLQGSTVDAAMLAVPRAEDLVDVSPPFEYTAEVSVDGHHLFVTPSDFLEPNTTYTLRFHGRYSADGLPVGNTVVAGTRVGNFDDAFTFRTGGERPTLPLRVGRDRVSAFSIRRLAVPLPSFLPSVNQIGFDSYDLITGIVSRTADGRVLLFSIGGRRDARRRLVPDPKAGFAFGLYGRHRGNTLLLSQSGLTLTFSFGTVPTRRFDVRMQLNPDLTSRPGANLYTEITCTDVPNYGPALFIVGLCNAENTLAASGTFLTERYRGPAQARPPRVRLRALTLRRPTADAAGEAHATLRAPGWRASRHLPSILLTDAATGRPLALDLPASTTVQHDRRGDVTGVRVTLPAGTQLPARIRAYVMADVFPLAVRELG